MALELCTELCPHLKQSFRLFFTAFLAIAVAPESGVLFGVSSGPRAAVGRGWQGSLSVQALSRDFVLEATKLLTWSPPDHLPESALPPLFWWLSDTWL